MSDNCRRRVINRRVDYSRRKRGIIDSSLIARSTLCTYSRALIIGTQKRRNVPLYLIALRVMMNAYRKRDTRLTIHALPRELIFRESNDKRQDSSN